MKTHTVRCPHCNTVRYAKLTYDGQFYDFGADGQCGNCGKWDDEPVRETEE